MRKFITEKLNKFFDGLNAGGKSIAFLCSVLTVICVVCVGFSSWIIVNPTVSVTVNAAAFDVYTVTDSQSYLWLDGQKGFDYYITGFTDGKGNLTETGDISFNVEFFKGKASAFFGSEDLLLQFTLYFTNVKSEAEANKVIPPAECVIARQDDTSRTISKTHSELDKNTIGEYYLKASFSKKDLEKFINENDTVNLTVTFKLANNAMSDTNYSGYTYSNLYNYLSNSGNNAFMIEARVSKA